MGTHMKTTVDIPDELVARAKAVAARERTTFRRVLIDGLRDVVERRTRRAGFRLRRASFKGKGLQPEFAAGSWEEIREAAYRGRGG